MGHGMEKQGVPGALIRVFWVLFAAAFALALVAAISADQARAWGCAAQRQALPCYAA